MATTVHIIHPSPDERGNLAALLANEAADVRSYESAEEFVRNVEPAASGCVVAPADLPGMGTRSLIEAIRAHQSGLSVVVLGRDSDLATAVELVRAGATEYLEPPVPRWRLRLTIRRLLEQSPG